MLLGADKRSAAEFSFFLAIPTMVGAFAYDLYKNFATLSAADFQLIGIGFLASFVMGLLVITGLLTYVSKHGFAVFAWWRIFLGSAGLLGFLVLG
jgi:undecaprenyl-diphosphatase